MTEERRRVGTSEEGVPIYLYAEVPWHLKEREERDIFVCREVNEVVRYHVHKRARIDVIANMPRDDYGRMAGRPVVSFTRAVVEGEGQGFGQEIVLYPSDYPITLVYERPLSQQVSMDDASMQIQLCMTPAHAKKLGRALSAYAALWEGDCTEAEAAERIARESDD